MIQERMDDEWASLFRRVCVRRRGKGQRRTTHVFGQEHRPPADLRAKVLEHHFVSAAHARSCENGVIIQWFGITFERELLSFDVELCRSGTCERERLQKLYCWRRQDRTFGNLTANAAFTSATFAISTGLSIVIASGKPRKRVDLPVEVTVNEVIVSDNPLGLPIIYLFIQPDAT